MQPALRQETCTDHANMTLLKKWDRLQAENWETPCLWDVREIQQSILEMCKEQCAIKYVKETPKVSWSNSARCSGDTDCLICLLKILDTDNAAHVAMHMRIGWENWVCSALRKGGLEGISSPRTSTYGVVTKKMETPFSQGVTWRGQGGMDTSCSWGDSDWTQEGNFSQWGQSPLE